MADQKRLFLLDAYALIFRGYYAFIKNPIVNSKGQDTSAIMGFMNSLFDVIRRERPDHLAVCFDKEGSVARTEIFEAYKAHRDATPEPILQAIPYIQDILKAMHIPVVVLPGCEADDIIGTLARQAEKEGYKVFMVTPDKDFAQLVSENIFIYRPARMGNGIEIWGIPEVLKRFEIERPEQVIDFLGMMGDAVDNIPGLPGVGEKTAKKFLKEFGSMENLLANTHKLKGKMKERIESHREQGLLSKKLAAIMCDCDVQFDAKDYELSRPDSEKVQEIFEELEFRRLKEQFLKLFSGEMTASAQVTGTVTAEAQARAAGSGQFSLFGNEAPEKMQAVSGRKSLKDVPHVYQSVSEGMGFELFLKNLMDQKCVCLDITSSDINPHTAEIIGIAFCWEQGKGFYLPFPKSRDKAQEILERLRPFFESETIEKVGQNLKNDLKVLAKYRIQFSGPMFDTMIAHYLINPDMRHSLDVLSETYLNYTPVFIEELLGKGKNRKSMRDIPLQEQTEFCVEDADVILQLKKHFEPELREAQTEELFRDMEIPLVKVLADMELEGIKLDKHFLKELSKELDRDIVGLEQQIYAAAGEEFNIGSPKQLGVVLFEKLRLVEKPKKTKTGQYSTGEEILSALAQDHEIVQQVLDYRGLVKLKNTYIDALPLQVDKHTGRVHTDYVQTVAATGRLSSNNPNLQNIPIRTERGRQVRKAFVPRDEHHILMAADYSQIELRIIAALSKEENMIDAFREGRDIHTATAARVFGVPLEAVTREQRSNAKTVNFGIVYGVSAFGLSNQTSLSRTESKDLIETYYQTYPKLRDFIRDQVEFAREKGYVQTVLGRRRYLRDINSQNAMVRSAAERNAVNAPIQGSAADIIKLAMIRIHNRLKKENMKSKMLLQVHDELVFDVLNEEVDVVKDLVRHEMENAFLLEVPLEVDLGLGQDWLEAH